MYQPLYVDGRTVGQDEAKRDAVTRYDAIAATLRSKGVLDGDGFTVIDIGAHSGYFSVRLAAETGAHVVAVDADPALKTGMISQPHAGVDPVYENLRPGDLTKMGPVDVILCLSVLHHVPWWAGMVEEILASCRHAFIETAMPGENLAWISERTEGTSKLVAGQFGAEMVCQVPGFDDRFLRPTWYVPGHAA